MLVYDKKIDKKNHEYIEITGYEGTVNVLKVPEEIEGLPVEAIGNHAFSGRQDIEKVELPESIRTLYGFAFHNCKSLKKISLYDSLDDYYDGVCRQCDALEEIELRVNKSWFEVVRNFLADNDKTLRFLLHIKDEGNACLTFPEYVYDFNENTMARTIQFSIAGSGYVYRECVDRRSINFMEYDKLFERAVIDGSEISEDIAIGRLLYPYKLEATFRQNYETFVRNSGKSILTRFITQYDQNHDDKVLETLTGLIKLQKLSDASNTAEQLLTEETLDHALKLATDKKLTKLSATLMAQTTPTPISTSEFAF